jgi:hypothetical protein
MMSVKKIESLEIKCIKQKYLTQTKKIKVTLSKEEKAELEQARREVEKQIEEYKEKMKKELGILTPQQLKEQKKELDNKLDVLENDIEQYRERKIKELGILTEKQLKEKKETLIIEEKSKQVRETNSFIKRILSSSNRKEYDDSYYENLITSKWISILAQQGKKKKELERLVDMYRYRLENDRDYKELITLKRSIESPVDEKKKKKKLERLVNKFRYNLQTEIKEKYKDSWDIFMGKTKYKTISQKIPIKHPYYFNADKYGQVDSKTGQYSFYRINTKYFKSNFVFSPTEEYITKFKNGEEVPIIPIKSTWTESGTYGRPAPAKQLFYLYGNNVYRASRAYSLEELKLLIMDLEDKERKKFERLKQKFTIAQEETKRRRERIPENVRIAVWRRDEGKCVECGSKQNLEYDHIIPVSKGGSNTARNIQLLCEKCNREKSDKII